MRILITAATPAELLPAQEICETIKYHDIKTMVTGIGATATAYHTLKALSAAPNRPFDVAINTGIAGSFCDSLPVGSVVRVVSDYFGDCGMQTASGFQSLFDAHLLDADTFPFRSGKLAPDKLVPEWEAALAFLPLAEGVTVQHLVEGCPPPAPSKVETMEGAAFFYVCMYEHIPCIALRAVSNKAGERDKSKWDIPLSLSALKKTLANILHL